MTRRKPMPLAARVAEKVMGWEVCRHQDCGGCDSPVFLLGDGWIINNPRGGAEWDPLANPGDLMDVIGAVRERGLRIDLGIDPDGCYVGVSEGGRHVTSLSRDVLRGDWRAALAKAVCRAALEAVQ